MKELGSSIDDLFTGPLEAFTSERNALSSRLKREGDSRASQRVRALKKPTVIAWAVNNVIQEHPVEIDDLLALRESELDPRALGLKRRKLIEPLTRRAESFLSSNGHPVTADTSRRISTTLMAGSTGVDEEAFRRGRLSRELAPTGFEAVWGSVDPTEDVPGSDEDRQAARDRARQLSEEASEAEREAHRLAREAAVSAQEAETARQAAIAAERRAEEAAARAEASRRKADEALEKGG